MLSKNCVGLELTRHLRLAVLVGRKAKYRLQKGFEIPDFLEMSEDDRRASLIALIKKHSIPSGNVFLTLASNQGMVRQLDLPVEVRGKLRSVIELQIESLSPWPASEVYWECSAPEPVKGAKSIVVNVAIVPKSTVDPWVAFFKSVHLPLTGCLLAPMALSQGVFTLSQDRPTIVLSCDGDVVDAVLAGGGRFAHRTVRGDSLGSMAQTVVQTLSAAMRLSADQLALICHGNAAATVFPEIVPTAFPPPSNFDSVAIPGFGAITAALAGFDTRAFANVLPANLQYRKGHLRLVPTYVLSVLLFLVCGGLLLRNTYQMYVYSNQVEAAITAITPAVKELGRQETELNALLEKEQILFSDMGRADPIADVMAELTHVLPRDTWLSAYALQGNTVTLTGYSDRATEVQKVLEESPLFREVQFSSPITKEDSKDRFVIRAVVEEVR